MRFFARIAHANRLHASFEFFHELVVDFFVDDGARARRTLLSLKPEGGNGDAFDGRLHVGVRCHDDRVFTAHLGDDALDPFLSRRRLRRAFVHAKSDFFAAGK